MGWDGIRWVLELELELLGMRVYFMFGMISFALVDGGCFFYSKCGRMGWAVPFLVRGIGAGMRCWRVVGKCIVD